MFYECFLNVSRLFLILKGDDGDLDKTCAKSGALQE
jgi:hypothetical protein